MRLVALLPLFLVLTVVACCGCGHSTAPGQIDPALGVQASPAFRLAAEKHTICTIDGSDMAVIHTDGTVSTRQYMFVRSGVGYQGQFEFTAEQKASGITSAQELMPCEPIVAKLADGSFWALNNPPQQLLVKPGDHVISIVQGVEGGMNPAWVLLSNGTVQLVSTGTTASILNARLDAGTQGSTKSQSGIIKLYARPGYQQGSERLFMLRTDGSVWVTDQMNSLPVQVQGLPTFTDLDICSHWGLPDTGVALERDGSVAYWGMPTNSSNPDSFPKSDKPQLTALKGSVGFVKVTACSGGAAAIDARGNIWVWGAVVNTPILRGSAVLAKSSTGGMQPTMIPGITNAVDVQISGQPFGVLLALALCKDGTVWAWGNDFPPKKVFENVRLPQ